MHICISDLTSIGSDNGLWPGQCQAINRTNAGFLLIGPLGTNFSEILIEILIFSFKKMHLKVSSANRRPFCLGLNVLTHHVGVFYYQIITSVSYSKSVCLLSNSSHLPNLLKKGKDISNWPMAPSMQDKLNYCSLMTGPCRDQDYLIHWGRN